MLCPDCNTYAAQDEIVCPRCGKLLDRQPTEEEELMSFRQGRHPVSYTHLTLPTN